MLNEFKKFAVKGNMLDMAVGIVIGAAFATIITSLVNDIVKNDAVRWHKITVD